MDYHSAHPEDPHYTTRSPWLRAAVLGANDGIVSVSSLVMGVAAAGADRTSLLIAGVAGVVSGAMSMAAGEYVSVSSQSDSERADIAREARSLQARPEAELEELTAIYRARGLSAETARLVAQELTAKDPLAAHLREELGLTELAAANPVQAALASGATFSSAAILPVLAAFLAPAGGAVWAVLAVTLVALAGLGAAGAWAGGAPRGPAMARTLGWGAFAMAVTAGVGWVFGIAV